MTLADIWETISDAGSAAGKKVQKVSNYDKEDFLAAVGLEPKRSTMDIVLPAAGFFAVGILAGVGLGLLFAPKPGYELREDLTEQLKGMTNKVADAADEAAKRAQDMNPVI